MAMKKCGRKKSRAPTGKRRRLWFHINKAPSEPQRAAPLVEPSLPLSLHQATSSQPVA